MHSESHRPLRHPFIEHAIPVSLSLDDRSLHFRRLGEWPQAVSALLEAQRRDPATDRTGQLAALLEQWRLADNEVDAGPQLRSLDVDQLVVEAQNAAVKPVSAAARAAEARPFDQDYDRDPWRAAWYLREAYRRNPDSPRTQHLLSITYFFLLDINTPWERDPAYEAYMSVSDEAELASRVEHLTELRKDMSHWLVVCPNSSGTWQLSDYLTYLGRLGKARYMTYVHKYRKQRRSPIKDNKRNLRWNMFHHFSNHTKLPLVVIGSLHDPVHALVYTSVRKLWNSHLSRNGIDKNTPFDSIDTVDVETVCAMAQALIDKHTDNDLAEYFKENYENSFGLPCGAFQIRHYERGYFVGFNGNLKIVLIRLPEIETALPAVLENIVCCDIEGCPPPSVFRLTSNPIESSSLRRIVERITLLHPLVERSLDTPFMEAHFQPYQLQAMWRRWLPKVR